LPQAAKISRKLQAKKSQTFSVSRNRNARMIKNPCGFDCQRLAKPLSVAE
jgi:hypothetical protein